jgi:hypothetical protein
MNKKEVVESLVKKCNAPVNKNLFYNNLMKLSLNQLKHTKIPKYNNLHVSKNKKNLLDAYRCGSIRKRLENARTVDPSYFSTTYKENNKTYSLFNKGNLQAFALLKNKNNGTRTINLVVSMKPSSGYGSKLVHQIVNDAKKNKKDRIELEIVHPKLKEFYKKFGFVYTPGSRLRKMHLNL